MLYAFDLDGTLVDSKAAVTKAYKLAGVTPPVGFFTMPWHEWLKNSELHEVKNAHYIKLVPTMVKLLPAANIFYQLYEDAIILTGASKEAADRVCQYFDFNPGWGLLTSMTVKQKLDWMNSCTKPGIMFEDNLEAAGQMRRGTSWTICHVL